MKKLVILFLTTFLFLNTTIVSNAALVREKSSVLLIFNNQAKKYYDNKLNAIAEESLNKKINGIYNKIDPTPYKTVFESRSFEKEDTILMQKLAKDSQADYFVYTELLPYEGDEGVGLIYYTKEMTATMVLRIFNLKESKEIFSAKYSLTSKDATDYFFVGNPSMAKKSLRNVLFKVGEAISVNLPL